MKYQKKKTATYGRFVCLIRPQKEETHRTRITVSGNLIDYPGNKSAKTADVTTVKILCNSIISTLKARAMCLDLKNFYLGTPMKQPEYMKIHISKIPPEVIAEYQLYDHGLVDAAGFVCMRIDRGIYGLPQAGIIANELLAKILAKHGYYQVRHTPGLWTHTTRPICFSLIVDNFLVKYIWKRAPAPSYCSTEGTL
jgi:hypothetical protein